MPSQSSPLRVLYIVATLPFILFALLYCGGAFHRTHQDKPAPPSASPANTRSPADQTSAESHPDEAARIDTAPHHPFGPNAANFYKNAYGLYKALNLSDGEMKLINNRSGKWDSAEAQALFEKLQPILALLRQSEDATYADWGIQSKKISERHPLLQVARDLAGVLAWNAAYEIPADPLRAVRDLKITMQIGQSVADDALVGSMVNINIAQMSLDLLASNAATLSPDARSAALVILGTREDLDYFAAGLEREANIMSNFADEVPSTSTDVGGQISYIAKIEGEFIQNIWLSDAQFESWWQRVQGTAYTQQFAKEALDVLPNFRAKIRNDSVQNRLLQAGLAMIDHGATALVQFPDPTTGHPFQLVLTPDGFELRSAFQYKGKPVVMAFPTAKP